MAEISYHKHLCNDEAYLELFKNNRKWVEEQLLQNPNYFKNLAQGQSPKYLFIGCSDSRVNANEITGLKAGDMFIHRNIANLVCHTDMNIMSVLQYAVEVLKVEHIIVCGHYGCGGVRAAMDKHYFGLIEKWLRNIKDVYRIHQQELSFYKDPEARHQRLVELNVFEQVYHVCQTSFVQNAWNNDMQLHVHGWVYDIEEGLLKDLNIDPKKDFKEFEDVYKYDSFR